MNIIDPGLRWKGLLDPLDKNKINGIALHHMDKAHCTIYDVHEWHLQNGWCGIGYAFWVSKVGEVYLGRGFNKNAGVLNENSHLISIGFEGEYENLDTSMPQRQYNAGVDIIKHVVSQCPNVNLIDGHRRWNDTTCPGKYFPLSEMVDDSWKKEEIDMKDYDLNADQIIDLVSSDPEYQKKFMNAIEKAANAEGSIGDLEAGKWIKTLVEKVWRYK